MKSRISYFLKSFIYKMMLYAPVAHIFCKLLVKAVSVVICVLFTLTEIFCSSFELAVNEPFVSKWTHSYYTRSHTPCKHLLVWIYLFGTCLYSEPRNILFFRMKVLWQMLSEILLDLCCLKQWFQTCGRRTTRGPRCVIKWTPAALSTSY